MNTHNHSMRFWYLLLVLAIQAMDAYGQATTRSPARLADHCQTLVRNGSYQAALPLCARAAAADHPVAHYLMAWMHEHGKGTVKDRDVARQHYEQAAQLGHPQAQVQLARVLTSSETERADYVIAYAWFERAHNNPLASEELRIEAGRLRELIAIVMTAKQIEQAKALAAKPLSAPTKDSLTATAMSDATSHPRASTQAAGADRLH